MCKSSRDERNHCSCANDDNFQQIGNMWTQVGEVPCAPE